MNNLPHEILVMIFDMLEIDDVITFSITCKHYNDLLYLRSYYSSRVLKHRQFEIYLNVSVGIYHSVRNIMDSIIELGTITGYPSRFFDKSESLDIDVLMNSENCKTISELIEAYNTDSSECHNIYRSKNTNNPEIHKIITYPSSIMCLITGNFISYKYRLPTDNGIGINVYIIMGDIMGIIRGIKLTNLSIYYSNGKLKAFPYSQCLISNKILNHVRSHNSFYSSDIEKFYEQVRYRDILLFRCYYCLYEINNIISSLLPRYNQRGWTIITLKPIYNYVNIES